MPGRLCFTTAFFLLTILAAAIGPKAATADNSSNLVVVGHDPLFDRGMNAAPAIYDHYVYIGNRTDSSSTCVGATGMPSGDSCAHPHAGILIVDVANPAKPIDAGEIGPPHAGKVGVTTRELRVWPDRKLLIVMDFRCTRVIHACASGTDEQYPFDISFFSLADPVNPKYLSSYVPVSKAGRKVKPHEMYLWIDPANTQRALLYLSTPSILPDPAVPNMVVLDISRVSSGAAPIEVAEGNWVSRYPGAQDAAALLNPTTKTCGPYDCNLFLHSMSLSLDGTRAYLAMEAGHFLVLDTTSVAKNAKPGVVQSLNDSLLTEPAHRPTWMQEPASASAVPSVCKTACPNSHSAVKVPQRQLVVTTDEVYGTFTDPKHGCPWGWEHFIDIADPSHPVIVGEYKIAQDQQTFCGSAADDAATQAYTSYSSHNPTVLRDLAIATWHSGGVQVTDISDPAHPTQVGSYSPAPLARVATEDPALNRGGSKVTMWSYPIIKDGLIYVVDIRNGLYILRYTGPHADEVRSVRFYEGNSDVGDGMSLDRSP